MFGHDVSVGHLLTWRTYGSWLPGDVRGWKPRREGFQSENRPLENYSQEHLRFDPVWLNRNQRQIIAETIVSHCRFRDWFCSAVTCQSNHVHVVLITTLAPRGAMARLKARCTRVLRRHSGNSPIRKLWADRGSVTKLLDERDYSNAVNYVLRHE